MKTDWLSSSADPGGIADLVVRRKWAKAVDILRARLLEGQVPSVQGRLQLADLLVMAGRSKEAVPILLGLADEFSAEQFVAKAIAILKRVERIEPGRSDVATRLTALAETQSRLAPARSTARRPGPRFDIEEVADDAAAAASSAAVAPGEAASAGVPVEAVGVKAEPASAGAEAPAGPAIAEGPGMTDRLRGVLKRFLGFLPGAEGEAQGSEESPLAPPTSAAGNVLATLAVPEGGGLAAEPDARPETPVPAEEAYFPEDLLVQPLPGANRSAPPASQPSEAIAMTPPTQTERPGEAAEDESAASAEVEPVVEALEAGLEAPGGVTADSAPGELPLAQFEAEVEADVEVEPELDEPAERVQDEIRLEAADVEVEPELESGADQTPTGAPSEVAAVLDLGSDGAESVPDAVLEGQILDLVEDVLRRPTPVATVDPATPPQSAVAVAARLVAVPLFGGLSSAELLAVVRGLVLRTFEPGDALVTEGERGRSLFVLSSGRARVFVRSLDGHAVEVAELQEGDFFGEASALSGGRRGATITAAARCEVLELEKVTLDEIARAHPRVREMLEETYVRRASDPETAAVRAADLAVRAVPAKAQEVLEARFGDARWDPRMRLRLADVLLKAGQYDEAVPILVSLVDELARHGFPEKAIAVVKKIERIQQRHIEQLPLAPLVRPDDDQSLRAEVAPELGPVGGGEHPFERWLLHLAREVVERPRAPQPREDLPPPRGYSPGLKASPLFEDFSEDELLELVRRLRLVSFQPGQIVVSEGEPGQSLFVVATGAVKVSVRDAGGRSVALSRLEEGAFFGEIATLSGRPRSATVTAAEPCDLLELDRAALDAITERHPRVRDILESAYLERAGALVNERAKTSS